MALLNVLSVNPAMFRLNTNSSVCGALESSVRAVDVAEG